MGQVKRKLLDDAEDLQQFKLDPDYQVKRATAILRAAKTPRTERRPIYSVGPLTQSGWPATQAIQRSDGQWFYRVLREVHAVKRGPGSTVWGYGKWQKTQRRPDGTWIDHHTPTDYGRVTTD